MTLASTSSSSITASTWVVLQGRPTVGLLPIIPILGTKTGPAHALRTIK